MNSSPRRRRWTAAAAIVGVMAIALCGSLVLAKPGVVKTKSGKTYYGDVNTAADGTVTVTIRGVEKRVAPEDVESVSEDAGNFRADFDARRKKVDPKDIAGLMALSQFALDNGEYLLAHEVVEQALAQDPKNKDALALRDTIRRENRADRVRAAGLGKPATTQSGGQSGGAAGGGTAGGSPKPETPKPESPRPESPRPESPKPEQPGGGAENPMPPAPTAPETPPAETGGEEAPGPTPPAAPGERRLLGAEDVQKIRRLELKRGESARIQIPQDVKRNFVAQNGLNFAQFNARPQVEQALEILDKGDDAMRAKVRILSDPESITQFKSLQRNLVQGCATSNCHGQQTAAAGFVLYSPDSDLATYTNFYILTHTSKKVAGQSEGGPFGGATVHALIERGTGEQSLLALYALPPGKSPHPHPRAGNYRGIYTGPEDGRYKKLIDWMNNVLKPVPPEPDYGINYPLPGNHRRPPSSQPASMPTTGP